MPDASTPQNLTQITISTDTLDTLRRIAARQNISLSDALRQAISVSQLLVEADSDADTHVLLKKGGEVQELKLLGSRRG